MPTETDTTAGPITIRPKLKNCGREDCSACPHGPYWYAVLAYNQTPNWRRAEIYLGQKWSPATIKEKVLPRVAPSVRGPLAAWIADQEATAQRAQLVQHLDELVRQRANRAAEAERDMKLLTGQIAALQSDLAALNKQHPPAPPAPKRKK